MKTKLSGATRGRFATPSLLAGLRRVTGALLLCAAMSASAWAAEPVAARNAEVQGVKLHYLTSGHGAPLLLLHGYAETSLMWRPLMPSLAERFTVIAPDLPGIGDSAIPADGLDMKAAAVRIHALMSSLGFQKAEVVGHDIGLMVAYAYAAMYPAETTKLVVMDAFLPGVAGWEAVYNNPGIWHFRFNGPTPEALVRGRERIYFDYFLERLRCRQDPFHPRSRQESLRGRLCAAGTDESGLGLFRFLQSGGERF
jgi:pimeloyl-ACP methyl ester carboxylesterase